MTKPRSSLYKICFSAETNKNKTPKRRAEQRVVCMFKLRKTMEILLQCIVYTYIRIADK